MKNLHKRTKEELIKILNRVEKGVQDYFTKIKIKYIKFQIRKKFIEDDDSAGYIRFLTQRDEPLKVKVK